MVDTFRTAARSGDVTGLPAMLAPNVARRADLVVLSAGVPVELRGTQEVATETAGNAARARLTVAVLVDGTVGAVVAPMVTWPLTFMFAGHRIATMEVLADPERLRALDVSLLTS